MYILLIYMCVYYIHILYIYINICEYVFRNKKAAATVNLQSKKGCFSSLRAIRFRRAALSCQVCQISIISKYPLSPNIHSSLIMMVISKYLQSDGFSQGLYPPAPSNNRPLLGDVSTLPGIVILAKGPIGPGQIGPAVYNH